MNRSLVLPLVLLFALPASTARAVITPEDLEAARSYLEVLMEGWGSTELGGTTMVIDAVVTTIHVTTIGMAFCSPPDPNAAPNPNPTPPYNAYGCVNSVSVAASLVNDRVVVSVSIPNGFVDFQTSRPELPYCLECVFNCGSVVRGGYATSPATFQNSYVEVLGPNGTRELISIPGTATLTLSNFSFHLDDGCMSTFAAIGSFLLGGLEGVAEDALEAELASIPIPLPLPVRSSTWGSIKALYSR
jgi:hypothetical protein